MKKLYNAYRALATVVGVLLAFCSLVAFPLKYLATDGSSLQRFGEEASIVWAIHGWAFIFYVVVTFLLARRALWTLPFSLVVLVAGLVPLMIFFVERVVSRRLHEEYGADLTAEPTEPIGL